MSSALSKGLGFLGLRSKLVIMTRIFKYKYLCLEIHFFKVSNSKSTNVVYNLINI